MMRINSNWEKAAKKRKVLALGLTIAFHLGVFIVLFGGVDFQDLKEKIKSTFKTEEVKQKA